MDDEEGYYECAIGDHVMFRYEVKAILGKGSFAQVAKCLDHKTGHQVAVKITRNTEIDHKFAASEAKLLNYLMSEDPHDEYGIVRLYEDFFFREHHLLATDLFEFMKERNFEGFTTMQIRKMAIQILRALAFFEERNLIHCDLKPENIVVVDKESLEIKLVDFGSGCFVDEQVYTYVQSRFYRAPEVILRMNYTEKVDMWSFGCILAELYTGEPIFPGNNEQEQIEYIMELCGIIPEEVVAQSRKKDQYFDEDYSPFLIEEEGIGIARIPASRTLEDAMNQCPDNDFLDFIAECLIIEPEKRITAKEAISHSWIKQGLIDYAPKKHKLQHMRTREEDVPQQAQIESPTKLIRTITNPDESVKKDKKNKIKKKKREYEIVKLNEDLDNWGDPDDPKEEDDVGANDGSGPKVQKITVTIYKRK